MKPRVFTRDQPCTKLDLHNAFWNNGVYRTVPLVNAQAIIGVNAPKYLIKKGFIVQHLADGIDVYSPTEEGKEWLRTGLARHLELHPDERARLEKVSPTAVDKAPKRAVSGPPKAPASKAQPIRRTRR